MSSRDRTLACYTCQSAEEEKAPVKKKRRVPWRVRCSRVNKWMRATDRCDFHRFKSAAEHPQP